MVHLNSIQALTRNMNLASIGHILNWRLLFHPNLLQIKGVLWMLVKWPELSWLLRDPPLEKWWGIFSLQEFFFGPIACVGFFFCRRNCMNFFKNQIFVRHLQIKKNYCCTSYVEHVYIIINSFFTIYFLTVCYVRCFQMLASCNSQ